MHLNDDCIVHTLVRKFAKSSVVKLTIYHAVLFGNGPTNNAILGVGYTRCLGARWAPTSSWRPFGPAFFPSGILDFILRALQALRPCDKYDKYDKM